MNFIEYPDSDMMMIDLANQIAGDLNAALLHEERVCLAVPGGTTPGPLFDVLCAADLPWDRVDVMLTDERWVPSDSDRSNTLLIRERLLVNRAAAARLLPLYKEAEQPEQVLDALEEMIAPELPIAVLLLGMGADMHTASLFPRAEKLAEGLAPDAPILLPIAATDTQETRVSLSARVLDGALRKHIVIIGAEKRAAFEKAQGLDPIEAPIKAVLTGADVHWAP
ncbi:6-phosphogluconolactonase [Planktotalea sp.]|uniref:6-phosphogluconolactonase n=1 Tax=Planktotalea sp. TaxID=2029877 RepID=UPI0025FF5F18|nr:6-phosphogluconolactonase [Planktotalea sp.]